MNRCAAGAKKNAGRLDLCKAGQSKMDATVAPWAARKSIQSGALI
jgi:hypothetical protein